MNKKVIKVVIIIVLFFSLVSQSFTRRSGHNSDKNDSSNDRSWNLFSWFSRSDDKKKKSSFFGGSINFMVKFFNYIWKFSLIVFCIELARQVYQQDHLEEQQAKVFEQFKEDCFVEPSVYNKKERQAIIQDFREKFLLMNVQLNDGLMALNNRLNISSINRLIDNTGSVGFEGSDELGMCSMDEYIGFAKDVFEIRLVKSQEVQLPTQQRGNGQKLIFEGFRNYAKVTGQWLQIGHQNDSRFSGIWNWVPQTQYQ